MIRIKIVKKDQTVICEAESEKEVILPADCVYEEGDRIVFEVDRTNAFYVLSPDDALGESLVYLTENRVEYVIPFGEKKMCYSPKIFSGEHHLLFARCAEKEETEGTRNLALNRMDQGGRTGCYPHASANVETRGESVFASHNVIDGVKANHSHGIWPYSSWGIDLNSDAEITIDFGREILAERLVVYERADFPHDNWWKQIDVRFSDGTVKTCQMQKTDQGQKIVLEPKKTSWIRLEHLIQSDEPSPFPALSQLEVYGKETES